MANNIVSPYKKDIIFVLLIHIST